MLIAAVAFAACEGPDINMGGPGEKPEEQDTTKVEGTAPDTIGWNIPAECLTVAQAREICAKLTTGDSTSTEQYYVMGWVKKVKEVSAQYGNATFYIEDVKGANSQEDFEAYRVKGPDNQKINNDGAVAVGDFVVLYGKIKNFRGTYETSNGAYIWKSTNQLLAGSETPNPNPNPNPEDVTGEGTFENPYTALDVIALGNAQAGNFYVKAYIVGQLNGGTMDGLELVAPFTPSKNTTTGQMNTYNTNIVLAASADEKDAAKMVTVQLPSGALRTGLNLPENPSMHGKEILIYGSLEKYCGVAGIKNPTYAVVDGKELGTKPAEITGDELLNETLMNEASFNKFTTVNVAGEQVWTFDAKYGAKMSGFANGATVANEDWFITPAMDLTGKNAATISFNHAFGPAAQVPSTDATKAQYTIWVSNDFDSDVKTATWTELKGMVYGTTGWGYVSSGDIAIPAENLKANCRIAWKYVCTDVSATWEIKDVIVK